MVRNYKKKRSSPSWTAADMRMAVSAVQEKELSARKASQRFGIPKTCLLRRLKNESVSGPRNDNFKPVFSKEQETELVSHVLDLESKFYGLTPRDVRKIAFDLAEKLKLPHSFNKQKGIAGKDWLDGFRKRNPEITIRAPEATSVARAAAFNKVQVKKFYDVLEAVMEKHHFGADQVFNVDETGINTVPKPKKIMAKTGRKQVGRIVSTERGFNVTVTCAMSASGQYIPPFFLFPRQRMSPLFMKGSPAGSKGFANGSGWMDSEHFVKYLEHFVEFAKPTETKKVLLIIDNHASHRTLEAITFARDNHIIMISLPPHTSHRLQPLDCTFYGPLKAQHSRECDLWMTNHPAQRITIYDIVEIFGKAFVRAATMEKAIKGFQVTGIIPFDPNHFTDEDFLPSQVTEVTQVTGDELFAEVATEDITVEAASLNIQEQEECSPVNLKNIEPSQPSNILEHISQISPVRVQNTEPPLRENILEQTSQPSTSFQNILFQVSPKPVSTRTSKKRVNRVPKTQHAEELTGSPFKNQKEAEDQEKKRKAAATKMIKKRKVEKKVVKKVEKGKKKVKVNYSNKKSDSSSSDSDEDSTNAMCIYCCGRFLESKSNEGWIQCRICKEWAHDACADADDEDNSIVCPNCE